MSENIFDKRQFLPAEFSPILSFYLQLELHFLFFSDAVEAFQTNI